MLRRTPLKSKRDKPRRDEGRVRHQRIKAKPGGKTAEEKAFHEWIAGLGCLVCGAPATVHHVTSDGFKRVARSHQRVAPLCPRHHQIQHGPRESVEALGHAGFRDRYGLDLLRWAIWAWGLRNDRHEGFWSDGVALCRAIAKQRSAEHKNGGGELSCNGPKDEQLAATESSTRLDQPPE